MPGITGFVAWDGKVPGQVQERMAAALGMGPARHVYGASSTNEAGMAQASLKGGLYPPRVAAREDLGILAAVDGEFLDPCPPPGSSPAETALQLYLDEGIDFAARAAGFFSLAIWDGRKRTLFLACDRSGLRPLFFWSDGKKVLFASEIKGLLAGGIPLARDPRGLVDFIVFGFPLGTRTLFEDVRGIPPGSITSIHEDGTEQRQYWRLDYSRAPRRAETRAGWLELLEGVIRETTAPMIGERTGVPLSGGMDSRIIAASVHALGAKAFSCTIGSEGSRDLGLGREISSRLGWEHASVVLRPEDLPARARLGVYLTDGLFPALDTHILHVAWTLPPGVDVALDGTSSFDGMYSSYDVLLHRAGLRKYPPLKQAAWVFTHPLFGKEGKLLHRELFDGGFLTVVEEGLAASLEELFQGIPSGMDDPFDRTDFLEQTQRVRRYNILGTVLLRNYVEVRHPFFHPGLIDLIERIPPLFRSKEKLVSGMLPGRLAPVLKGLEYERTGWRAGAGSVELLLPMALKAVRKLGARLMPGLFPKRGIAVDYQSWLSGDEGVQAFFRDLLAGDRALSRGIFQPDRMKILLEEQIQGRGGHMKLLNRLLSLELWHRFFLDGDSPPLESMPYQGSADGGDPQVHRSM